MITYSFFFLIRNIFYFSSYSTQGDYADYFIFSFEYLSFCTTVFYAYKLLPKIYIYLLSALDKLVIITGFTAGAIGIILFAIDSQDYNSDNKFSFHNGGQTYQTKRYNYGFATITHTKYEFETYEIFEYLPVEKLIDRPIFHGTETNLIIGEDVPEIGLNKNIYPATIEFKSTNGEAFFLSLSVK